MSKNVVITGASGNLGQAVVEKFMSKDYKVIATISPGKTKGSELKNAETFETDLTNEKEVESTVAWIVSKNETIDVALLLVGGYAGGGIKETNGESLRKMYSMNFETAYFAARPIFLQMLQQKGGGRIVLVGSRPSLIAKDGKNAMAYSLSKSLLFKLAEQLNAEGAAHNVITSVVVPSTIDTPVNRQAMPTADFSKWVKAEEIADVMFFIAENKIIREPVYKVYGGA